MLPEDTEFASIGTATGMLYGDQMGVISAPAAIEVHRQKVVGRKWQLVQIPNEWARWGLHYSAVIGKGDAFDVIKCARTALNLPEEFQKCLFAFIFHNEVYGVMSERLLYHISEEMTSSDIYTIWIYGLGQMGKAQALRRGDGLLSYTYHIRLLIC